LKGLLPHFVTITPMECTVSNYPLRNRLAPPGLYATAHERVRKKDYVTANSKKLAEQIIVYNRVPRSRKA